jgi:hypothetical protein
MKISYLPLLAIALFAACGRNISRDTPGDISSDISKIAASSADQAVASNPSVASPSLQSSTKPSDARLYIDASQSMTGYLGEQPATYTSFSLLINALGDSLPGCRVFRYGQATASIPQGARQLLEEVDFDHRLHQPAFYNLLYNPDDRLIETFNQEEHPGIRVLISDGVYSRASGGTTPPVVQAIAKWFQRGGSLGVFTLTSQFDGRFYSELRRSMLPGNIHTDSRPFHIFIFSPSRSAIDSLFQKLSKSFPTLKYHLFANDSISVSAAATGATKAATEAKFDSKNYQGRVLTNDIWDRTNKSYSFSPFVVTYTCANNYPATALSLTTVTTIYQLQRKTPHKAPRFVPTPSQESSQACKPFSASNTSADHHERSSDCTISLTAYRELQAEYMMYGFRVYPKAMDRDPAITALSTLDDSAPKNVTRTYRWSEFMDAITDVHLEQSPATKASQLLFVVTPQR